MRKTSESLASRSKAGATQRRNPADSSGGTRKGRRPLFGNNIIWMRRRHPQNCTDRTAATTTIIVDANVRAQNGRETWE